MTSESKRDPISDHLLTPENAALIVIDYQPTQVGSIRSMDPGEMVFNLVSIARAAVTYKLPIIHSTVNVTSGRSQGPIAPVMEVIGNVPIYDRTTINSWEDVECRQAIEAAGRRKLIIAALWTEACLTFPALDAMLAGYEVYVPVDAVGGTSLGAHEAALRRMEQAGAKLTGRTQIYCELQRDWNREATIPGLMDLFKRYEGANSHPEPAVLEPAA
jgi:nicotinamidase-related amidase